MRKTTAILLAILTLLLGVFIGAFIQSHLNPVINHYQWVEHRIERFA